MERGLYKLSALDVKRLLAGKPIKYGAETRLVGSHPDGGRLYLVIKKIDVVDGATVVKSASWIQKTRFGEVGLGAARDVSLAGAREAATKIRELAASGVDPRQHREDKRRAEEARQPHPFQAVATEFLPIHAEGWVDVNDSRNLNMKQWTRAMMRCAYPVIGRVDVDDVTVEHVLTILEPLWTPTRASYADKLRLHIGQVLDWAVGKRWRDENKINPCVWGGRLKKALIHSATDIAVKRPHPALPHVQVGEFLRRLRAAQDTALDRRAREGNAPFVIELILFSAKRWQEVALAYWREFDLAAGVWTIPKERMKGRKNKRRALREPLSASEIALLRKLARVTNMNPDSPVFPGRGIGLITNRGCQKFMDRLGFTDETGETVVQHGFRASFSTWAHDCTAHDHNTIEACLAHITGNDVSEAYNRGEMFEKRRALMADWATYIEAMALANDATPLTEAA